MRPMLRPLRPGQWAPQAPPSLQRAGFALRPSSCFSQRRFHSPLLHLAHQRPMNGLEGQRLVWVLGSAKAQASAGFSPPAGRPSQPLRCRATQNPRGSTSPGARAPLLQTVRCKAHRTVLGASCLQAHRRVGRQPLCSTCLPHARSPHLLCHQTASTRPCVLPLTLGLAAASLCPRGAGGWAVLFQPRGRRHVLPASLLDPWLGLATGPSSLDVGVWRVAEGEPGIILSPT